MLLDLNAAGFGFYSRLPLDQREEWTISYDFHIINDGNRILVNHKLTPLALTSDGRIWLALCVVFASDHTTAGHIEMHRTGDDTVWEYDLKARRWGKKEMPRLTDGEKSDIILSIQGLTINEIADRLCLAFDTIKGYRRRLFEKLSVSNISEAIVCATNNKLI